MTIIERVGKQRIWLGAPRPGDKVTVRSVIQNSLSGPPDVRVYRWMYDGLRIIAKNEGAYSVASSPPLEPPEGGKCPE